MNNDHPFYNRKSIKLNEDFTNQLILFEETLKKIKLFDYEFLFPYFFKIKPEEKEIFLNKNKWKENFEKSNNEYQKKNILNEISFFNQELLEFRKIFLSEDINFLKTISFSILKLQNDFTWKIELFYKIIGLNNEISSISYIWLGMIEKYIKNVIQSKMILLKFNFIDTNKEKFKIKEIQNYKDIKHHKDIMNNPKKIPIALSVLSWNEIIKLIEAIEDEKVSNEINLNIYGKEKINNQEDVFETKRRLINDLEKIKKLRDKIMHFDYILPANDDNILMESIKALISIDRTYRINNGFTTTGFGTFYNQILSLVTNFLLTIHDEKINLFFQKNILSYPVYN